MTDIEESQLRKHSRDESDEIDDQPDEYSERPKLLSSVGAVVYQAPESNDNGRTRNVRQRVDQGYGEVSKPTIQDVFKQPDVVNRNKRLFGSLMGHLGSARQLLEKDSELIRKQQERQQAAAHKSNTEYKKLSDQRDKDKKRETADTKVAAIKSSFSSWKSHMETLSEFIMTETEPRLAWIPANSNKTTKDLLSKRKEEIARIIGERELADKASLQQIYGQYNIDPDEYESRPDDN